VIRVNERGEEIERREAQAEYRREDLSNGVTLDLMKIPAGSFTMGQTDAEKAELIRQFGEEDYQKYFASELPPHRVTMPSFWIGKYAVTQAQWQAVAALPKSERDLDPDPSNFKGANRPVEQVSWHEAIEFCARLSAGTGRTYRLPSKAEWEYACRSGATTPFHFGETITPEIVNYDGNYTYGNGSEGVYRQETTDVGSFQVANDYGLYDMHGNVWEWCLDHWRENYNGAPIDGRAWTDGGNSSYRMLRGGSWYLNPRDCRSAYRNGDAPDYWYNYIGFRVVVASAWTLS
jgi:formylglycine-generating enzyme required for sulfatase activity